MNKLHRIVACGILSLMVLAFTAGPAPAQKSTRQDKTKTAQGAPSSIREVLQKYEGKATSLGTLKRVAGDYFVVEQDGVTSMHPLAVIHTLRIVRDEEAGTEILEIHLIAD